MLLKVVTFTGNVDRNFLAVAQTNTRDFSQSGVRLLGGHRPDLQTDTLLLRALLKHRRLALALFQFASLADELIDCWHGNREMWVNPHKNKGELDLGQTGRGVPDRFSAMIAR